MTRQDLVNKSIDKLNTVKEALELIEILEYDECIAVLTGTKNLPSEIHSALMRRGKEANGGKTTLEEMSRPYKAYTAEVVDLAKASEEYKDMKKMLESNKAMQTLVSGEAGETVEKDM